MRCAPRMIAGMAAKSRTWYPTKAAWAAAKAAEARAAIDRLPRHPSADWRKVRARMRAIDSYRAEAARYDRLAEVYRQRGQ